MASMNHHPSAHPSVPSYQQIVVQYPTADEDDYDLHRENFPSGRRRAKQVLLGTMLLSIVCVGFFYQSPNAVSMSSSKEDFVVPVFSAPRSWLSKDQQVLMGRSKKDKAKSKHDKESKKEDKSHDKASKKEDKNQAKMEAKEKKDEEKADKNQAKMEAKEKKAEEKEEKKTAKKEENEKKKAAQVKPDNSAEKDYWKNYGNQWKDNWRKYVPTPAPTTLAPTFSAMPTVS